MRWLIVLLLGLLGALQYSLWIGTGSLADVHRLHLSVAKQTRENARLSERNKALEAEVRDLKHGFAAIEERARTELGMIKQGETFYQVVEEPQTQQKKDNRK
ncbi:MAG: cell division protein FtsB [Gammaproteobacteria bacterium]|jgi:cell division protein FtsB